MTSGAELEVRDVLRTFGGIRAVDHVSFDVSAGGTLGIIGPNGAGKTVLLNVINGLYPIEAGSIRLDGRRIDALRPHQIEALSVGRTFQATEQFHDFQAADYVMLGRARRQVNSLFACAVSWPTVRRSENKEVGIALDALERLGLRHVARERISQLPYGVQKLVDIARVIASGPRLMLLDEPTSGTTSEERSSIAAVLRAVAATDVTMLVIDHDVVFISSLSEQLLVMNYGRVLATGTPRDVLAHPGVIDAYLGI